MPLGTRQAGDTINFYCIALEFEPLILSMWYVINRYLPEGNPLYAQLTYHKLNHKPSILFFHQIIRLPHLLLRYLIFIVSPNLPI